jgi:hypothetical protein
MSDATPQVKPAAPERPRPPRPRPDAIPAELTALPQWVGWTYELRGAKWTKVLKNPKSGRNARANDPATWGALAESLAWMDRTPDADGVGFVFTAAGPYFGLDLDRSLDEDGRPLPWAGPIIDRFPTYGEVSPSGRGLHLIGRGRLPGKGSRKPYGDGEVEVYDRGRYFTMTGRRLPQSPPEVRDHQAAVDWLLLLVFPPPRPKKPPRPESGPTPLTDDQIRSHLERAANAAKYQALMRGDLDGYGDDHSRADAALCSLIAFYTDDAAQIERLFGDSELARRCKWTERPDYRARTVAYVLSQKTERYAPPFRFRPPAADGGGGSADGASPSAAPDPDAHLSYRIILDWLRERYDPAHRIGPTGVYSNVEGREIRPGEALHCPPIDLIRHLAGAKDAPRDKHGVAWDKLPWHFNNWKAVAWAELLRPLKHEEECSEVSAPAEDDFKRQVAAALFRPVQFGNHDKDTKQHFPETRTVIDWLGRFGASPRWGNARHLLAWSRKGPDGRLQVALRVELFEQLHCRELAGLTFRQFAERAERYGVGRRDRAAGERAVVLDDTFLDELRRTPAAASCQVDEDGASRTRVSEESVNPSTQEQHSEK